MPQSTSDIRRILVIGKGGREHALAWALARSEHVAEVFVAPGNGAAAGEPKVTNVSLRDKDVEGLAAFARKRKVDLTVVGPENALARGVVDHFREHDLTIFGPTRDAARLETSKVWAREFMARHDIPHPRFVVCEDVASARAAVAELDGNCVLKADGLAAGKGVIVCSNLDEAMAGVDTLMVERRFGAAASRVLVEERASGPELSVMAITDGRDYRLLAPSQDHKRLLEGDTGPNTGGMGAYAPAPLGSADMLEAARHQVIEPTLRGMAAEGTPFSGCLYCGLMLTDRGLRVIEYNTRFGDPETQVQLPLVTSDLARLLWAAARGGVAEVPLTMDPGATAVGVVLAARGYPGKAHGGMAIEGLATAERRAGVKIFHAGTRIEDGRTLVAGGRVLNVVCVREGLNQAVRCAYGAIGASGVHFEGMTYRTDIAFRALSSGSL